MDATIESLESHLQPLIDELRDTQSLYHRHSKIVLSGNLAQERAALEMLGAEVGIEPGLEDLRSFAESTGKAISKKLGRIGESIAIFFDTTGKRELARLRREVSELGDKQPKRTTISDRKLANTLTLNNVSVSDLGAEASRVEDFANALTDKYIPAVITRDSRLWNVMQGSGYLRNGQDDSLEAMIDDLISDLAKNHKSFLSMLPDKGLSRFPGGRGLMVQGQPPTFRAVRNASDPDTTKLIEHYRTLTITRGGRSLNTRPQVQSYTGVAQTLTVEGMTSALDAVETLTRALERATAILNNSPAGRLQSNVRTVLNSAEVIEEYEVGDETSDDSTVITTSNLSEPDSNRLRLVIEYVTHPQFNAAALMIDMTYVIASQWRTYVDYIKSSMRQYK